MSIDPKELQDVFVRWKTDQGVKARLESDPTFGVRLLLDGSRLDETDPETEEPLAASVVQLDPKATPIVFSQPELAAHEPAGAPPPLAFRALKAYPEQASLIVRAPVEVGRLTDGQDLLLHKAVQISDHAASTALGLPDVLQVAREDGWTTLHEIANRLPNLVHHLLCTTHPHFADWQDACGVTVAEVLEERAPGRLGRLFRGAASRVSGGLHP